MEKAKQFIEVLYLVEIGIFALGATLLVFAQSATSSSYMIFNGLAISFALFGMYLIGKRSKS